MQNNNNYSFVAKYQAILYIIYYKFAEMSQYLFILLLIGYIETINTDSNNMTKSGTLIPVVDFKHMSEVLVIREKKESDYK